MRILIANDGQHAHFYERSGLLKAFNSIPDIHCKMFECRKYSPFDIFDSYEPDIFIGQLYNLDDATIKCIKERPNLKVALRAGDWGDIQNEPKYSKFNILRSESKDIEKIKKLKDETGQPDFIYTHYNQSNIQKTHGYFNSIGIRPVGIMLGADIFDYYGGKYDENYACDLSFVGGYWPYKGININKTLLRLCHEQKYNIKIFSARKWPTSYWSGDIRQDRLRHVFYSSKICPNVHEPHSTVFGIDVNERTFKTMCSGGFSLSDNKQGQQSLFTDNNQVSYYDNDNDFLEKVSYFLDPKNNDKRKKIALAGQKEVLENHTYFERAGQFLNEFGFTKQAKESSIAKFNILQSIENISRD